MKVTMSVIKVGVGSLDGHVRRSRELENAGTRKNRRNFVDGT